MSYITHMPTVSFNEEGHISVGYSDMGDIFGLEGSTVDSFRVHEDAGGPGTLVPGDSFAVFTETGRMDGIYKGTASIEFEQSGYTIAHGIFEGMSINFQPAPLEGFIMQNESGSYLVTDGPLDYDAHMVTATLSYHGETYSVTAPHGEIAEKLAEAVSDIPYADEMLPSALPQSTYLMLDSDSTMCFDPEGETVLDPDSYTVSCFTAGTLIETPDGPRKIEDLVAGDLVLTKDNGPQAIRWIGSTRVTAQGLALRPNLRPIRIRAGALGANIPATDLVVSPQHRILVSSAIAERMFGTQEVLVAAKQLLILDGIDIAQDMEEVQYLHMLFDRHEIVASNGAETESLYTGTEALKSMSAAAREEIFTLFPELKEDDYVPMAARTLTTGRQARKFASRHRQHNRPLIAA